jgi:uncharacterized repeat protein (TIGR01451 family)/fimbrial isopeptide formation D2 family protein
MKRKLIAFSATMALLLSVFSVANVGAFTATIEAPTNTPSRAEWDFAKQPDLAGEGIIQRNATQQGAFVFNDATGDQRVVAQNSTFITDRITREVDLDWFSVTADANNIYFMAKTDYYRGIQNNPALELVITVDTNHSSGVGSLALPNTQTFSTTNVPADAAWEFAIDTKFSPGSPTSPGFVTTLPKIFTTPTVSNTCLTCAAQLASAAINAGSFAEIKVPWSQIGLKPTGANFLRFTVATMYNTHISAPDGYNSPVMDVLGSGSTLADIQDGTLGTSFDVHFDTNGAAPTYEPYAPLMVTEFQADTTGKDDPAAASNADSEWIEVYNPNTFAITDLNNYKVGNAAKRGSGEGMFKFKATSIPAKGVVLVARSKPKFLAAHPGYVGTVYDLSSDMTQYNAWSTGTTIDLANGPSAPATTFEEQVLILDAKDDIVDMATYGNTATPYPGHTDFPVSVSTPETSYERCPATRDTNNSSVDFSFHGLFTDETPGVVCDGVPGLDLTVAKTGPSTPTKDDTTGVRTVNYTINYSNIGTAGEAGTVTVVDTLPAGLTFTNTAEFASPQPNSVVGQNLTWTFAGLPAATSGTIVLTATVDSSVGQNVPLTNNVTINGPSEQAAAKNNNSASWTTTTLGPADTNVSTNLSGAVPPGAQFQFTINYQNTGQDDATDTTITDVLPAGVTILSQDSPGATWDGATTGTVTWNVGTLAPNESGTIVVTAQLASATPVGSTLTNAVDITVPANDPTPANNVESVNLTVGLRKLYIPIQLR